LRRDYSRMIASLSVKTAAVPIFFLLLAVQVDAATVEKKDVTEVYGEPAGLILTGRLGFGYLSGEAHEYVYWPKVGGHTASELTWEMDSTLMVGIGATIRSTPWLNLGVDLWFNVNDGDGYMEDYDWLLPGVNWTDKSVHDNTDVTSASMFDINAEVTFFSANGFVFNGIAGFRRDRFEWEARGGSYIYSINSFRDTAGTFPPQALAITYEQTLDVPYFGVAVTGDFGPVHLAAKVTGSIFVRGKTTDQHHMRDLVSYGDFNEGEMWGVDVALAYDITDHIGIKVAYLYEYYDTIKGNSKWCYSPYGYCASYVNNAGVDLETSMFSVAAVYSF